MAKKKIFDGDIKDIVSLYKDGLTLMMIGNKYGVSRERIRQILKKEGLTRNDGGQAVTAKATKRNKVSRSNELKQIRFGCTLDQWNYYRSLDDDYKKTPLFYFHIQKCNAKSRGICWDLTINEWWYIWQTSGHWSDRGRGKYVMARHGDTGGYTIDNVYITTASENSSEYYMLHMDEWIENNIKKQGG